MSASTIKSTKVMPGDDLHLTLLMAPYHLNLVVGDDRKALLAYGRAVWQASRNTVLMDASRPARFEPGSSPELNAIHAVIMSIGDDWPEVEGDPYTLYHVKRMARELQAFHKADAAPFTKHPNPVHHSDGVEKEHLLDVVEYSKGINAALDLWIAAAQCGITNIPCPVVYAKTKGHP